VRITSRPVRRRRGQELVHLGRHGVVAGASAEDDQRETRDEDAHQDERLTAGEAALHDDREDHGGGQGDRGLALEDRRTDDDRGDQGRDAEHQRQVGDVRPDDVADTDVERPLSCGDPRHEHLGRRGPEPDDDRADEDRGQA
jgi:hypothetical protein